MLTAGNSEHEVLTKSCMQNVTASVCCMLLKTFPHNCLPRCAKISARVYNLQMPKLHLRQDSLLGTGCNLYNHNRNLQTSKAPLDSQSQGTSALTKYNNMMSNRKLKH